MVHSRDGDGMEIVDDFARAARRVRKADDGEVLLAMVAPAAKRQMSASPSTVVMPMEGVGWTSTPAPIPSADDVLIDMIRQSGVRTYAEVVEFCRATGIPLSRMLRLDLMRQLQTNNTTTNNNNSGR